MTLFSHPPNRYLNQKLNELSEEENIDYLDLWYTFEKNKDNELYYGKDGHTNTTGHVLIARALAEFIFKKSYLTL